ERNRNYLCRISEAFSSIPCHLLPVPCEGAASVLSGGRLRIVLFLHFPQPPPPLILLFLLGVGIFVVLQPKPKPVHRSTLRCQAEPRIRQNVLEWQSTVTIFHI